MRSLFERRNLAAVIALVGLMLAAAPSYAIEGGLFGVRIGASYRELLETFGTPDGILFPSGSGLVFQTAVPASPQGGLPDFSQQTQVTDMPVWVLPVRGSTLAPQQTQWVYNFQKTKGIAIGILLNGEGADAIISDVIVAGYPKYLEGKPAPIRTAKGVVLQSTFEDVLKRYGYPPLIEIYPPSGATGGGRAAGGGGAMRAGTSAGRGSMRAGGGGMRGGGGARGGMRGGGGARGRGAGRGRGADRFGQLNGQPGKPGTTTMTAAAPAETYAVELTGAPGGRRGGGGGRRGGGGGMRGGGMRGGGMRGGGMRGGGMRGGGGGRAGLPPLGVTPTQAPGEELTATAAVDHQQISFSRDCTMVYEGIAFTLHNMKVYRIHVSE